MRCRHVPLASSLAGALALLSCLVAAPAGAFTEADTRAPLSATVEPGRFVALRGRIVPGSEAVVRQALDRAGADHAGSARPTVLLDSPGGSIAPALAIGRLIRARGLSVAVARAAGGRITEEGAACASACVLVLAGGVERRVGPEAGVGVHRLVDWTTYSRTWDVYRVLRRRGAVVGRELLSRRILSSREVYTEAPARDYAAVARYLAEMGEAPGLVALMRGTPAARLHWMTPAELAATRIATPAGAPGGAPTGGEAPG